MDSLRGGFSTGFAVEPGGEHIGQEQAALLGIEES
jgi:hypothetical protein